MSNPTSPQPGRPSTRPARLPTPRPAPYSPGPTSVVYRYTQKFRQEWQTGPSPSTWGPRLVARLLDLAVIGIPFNLVYNFIFTFVPEDWLAIGLPTVGRDVVFWLVFGLVTVLTAHWWEASLGKKLMHLRVARPGNSRLPFLLFFLRETLVAYTLVSFYQVINFLVLSGLDFLRDFNWVYVPGFILGLGSLPLFLNPPRPTLHDRLFKTTVVLADPQKL